MNFHLQVLSPEKKIYDDNVDEVLLPTVAGDIAVLPRHMPLVTPLTFGEVHIKKDGVEVGYYTIGKGLFFINQNEASLLIEDVKSSDEISEGEVELARKKAQELIERGVTPEEKLQGTYLLRRTMTDLKMIRKKQKKFT